MTPRKTSRRQQQHFHAQPTPLVQQSDFDESDVPQVTQESHARPARTNTELNLSVLRRYNPSIQSILSIAASAVVYNFNPPESWEKAGIEGTLFVCEEAPDPVSGGLRFCVVILNRRGLNNLILELSEVVHIELAGEYVVVHQGGSSGEDQPTKTIGLWMHPDKDDTREVNGTLISQCWERVMESKPDETVTASDRREGSSSAESWNMVPEQPPLGRKLSLRDLFAQIR